MTTWLSIGKERQAWEAGVLTPGRMGPWHLEGSPTMGWRTLLRLAGLAGASSGGAGAPGGQPFGPHFGLCRGVPAPGVTVPDPTPPCLSPQDCSQRPRGHLRRVGRPLGAVPPPAGDTYLPEVLSLPECPWCGCVMPTAHGGHSTHSARLATSGRCRAKVLVTH